MCKIILFLLIIPFSLRAQLTVETIMQDPKWIGSSPSGVFWNFDSKSIYFKWNLEKNGGDSFYVYTLAQSGNSKSALNKAQFAQDIQNGKYNTSETEKVFVHDDDIYLLNISTGKILRITQPEAQETNPLFTNNDSDIVFTSNNNLIGDSSRRFPK